MALPSARYFSKNKTGLRGRSRLKLQREYVPLPRACELVDLAPSLPEKQRPLCPKCERIMIVLRNNKLAVFWSCPRFPVCRGTHPINQQKYLAWLRREEGRPPPRKGAS